MNLLARGNADVLEDGTYAICSKVDENYCIGVTGASTSSEALVQPQKYTGANHQLWTVSHDSNGYVQFKNVNSGMWLNDKNGSTSNKSPIQQYQTDSTTDYANKWIVTRESNGYRIVTGWENTHSKLRAVDLYNNDTSESGLIDLYENNDTIAQRWIFKKVSD